MESLRQRILDLLRACPDGIVTLRLMERLGIERRQLTSALHDLRQRGLIRGTGGYTPASTIWTAVADSPAATAGPWRRGAAAVERARARSAAMAQARPQH